MLNDGQCEIELAHHDINLRQMGQQSNAEVCVFAFWNDFRRASGLAERVLFPVEPCVGFREKTTPMPPPPISSRIS